MSDALPVQEHLRKLAEDYRNHHAALQERYQQAASAEEFTAELRRRESALVDRFRLVQLRLLGSLQGDHLSLMLDLSRIFDEMRVVHTFALHVLTETRESAPSPA
jgi:hypothetical protein